MWQRRTAEVAGLVLLVLAGAVAASGAHVQPAVGHRAPDFTLRDPQGKSVQLSRIVGERAVFLNFWATWCPPCREEMPTMERAYRDYQPRGLEILAVSIDAGTETAVAAKVRAFFAEFRLTFPAVLDSQGDVVNAYRLRGLPTSFLIDRQGMIRWVEIGYRDWSSPESRGKLEELVK